ncbi:hypothetical protein Tco_0233924, partial [Tanacetum coccineum]
EDTSKAKLPPCKRLCLTALTSRYEVEESLNAAPRPARGHGIDYRFTALWMPKPDVREPRRVTELTVVQEQDTQDIYAMIEDAQDRQTRIFQSVETLIDDRTHAWMQDHHIDAQDSLIAALTAYVSSLQGHLAMALGEIRSL